MTRLVLEITERDQPVRRMTLAGGLKIGRGEANDIVLHDTKASEFHASIEVKDGGFVVRDCGSTNLTHVFQGPSLKEGDEWPLVSGARFMIGQTEFIVSEPTQQGSTAAKTECLEAPKIPGPNVPERPLDVGSKGPMLSPNTDLSPSEIDDGVTGEEEFPAFDTGMIPVGKPPAKISQDEPSPADSTMISTPEQVPGSPVESTIVARPDSEAAPFSEGKTTANPMPVIDPKEDISEGKTDSVSIPRPDFSQGAIEETMPLGDGPDPDEATIMSPPPVAKELTTNKVVRRDHSDASTVKSPTSEDVRAHDDVAEDSTTDQVVVRDAGGGEKATVLSPHVSAAASEKTVASKPNIVQPPIDEASPESTILSDASVPKGDPDRSFASDATRAAPAGDGIGQQLNMMQPRIIFADSRTRIAAKITKDNYTIGRASHSQPVNVDCPIDHATISAEHAAVVYREGRFYLEDRGSRNGTKVDGHELAKMTRSELKVDTRIKLGMVEGLFVADRDRHFNEPDRSSYRSALEFLVRCKAIRPTQAESLWQGCVREHEHPGEKLILEGRITVKVWIQALLSARADFKAPKEAGPGLWKPAALLMMVIAITIVSLIVLELQS